MERLKQAEMQAFTFHDPAYPTLLKEIYDYPPVIFVKGQLTPEDETCLGVVGTRKASLYGKQVTAELVRELCHYRLTIVSGLARGIDAVAHKNSAGKRRAHHCRFRLRARRYLPSRTR